jgi:hypothetical protein
MHCGVYYVNARQQIEFLHLASQRLLISAQPDEKHYCEISCPFPERVRIAVSNLCRFIFKKHGLIGLRFAATSTDEFSPKGNLLINRDGTGFTCATLVKGIFYRAGQPIINESTWPPASDEDREWWEGVMVALERSLPGEADALHYEAIDCECEWSRFKPEQVAAAMPLAPPPASFQAVNPRAQELAKAVRARYAPIPALQA